MERANGLLATINDLLDLAKIREGRSNPGPWKREININQLLADLFDSLAPTADEHRVSLVPDFEGVAVQSWGIPPDLVHAFENLIHNAIKYSRPGGRVIVRLRVGGGLASVRVIDEGIGIPPEYLEQVFLEFVRAPNAKHHAAVGTGLGLAIVREVIQAHGGRIEVESSGDGGTTFAAELPLSHRPIEVRRLLHTGNEPGYDGDTHRRETPPV
jgi:signal transduction histidine kinase